MNRREFLAGAGLVVAGCRAGRHPQGGGPMVSKNSLSPRPNILVLHGDQHRMDCLGAYGNPEIRTPHLDALASDGVRFDQSFCPYPVCTPSRYSLLSGLYVHQHRGWTNHCTLPPETPTFASCLRDAGYATKAVGKMHFTPTYLDVGFQDMVLSEQDGPGRWDDDYHRELMRLGLADVIDLEDQVKLYRDKAGPGYWECFGARPSNLPDELHSTQWIGDRAVEAVQDWGPSGNLLMVGFVKPHHPFDPPPRLKDAYDPSSLSLLPGWTDRCLERDIALSKGYFPHESLSPEALRRIMACYYATIQHMDEQVGRLVSVLKDKGLYDDALILYTSDHGEYMGFHHLLLKGNHLYDPLVKVPLLVKFPGQRRAGSSSSDLVSTIDVAPTLLAAAGVPKPDSMQGLDLSRKSPSRSVILTESQTGTRAMARTQDRKLLLSWNKGQMSRLFFDLKKDPREIADLSQEPGRKGEIEDLERAILDWRGFEGLPSTNLDEMAPVIQAPHVPSRQDRHREEIMAYYEKKMSEEQDRG